MPEPHRIGFTVTANRTRSRTLEMCISLHGRGNQGVLKKTWCYDKNLVFMTPTLIPPPRGVHLQTLQDNTCGWVVLQYRAACLAASHHDNLQHRDDGDNDGRGKQGDIIIHGRGDILGGGDTGIDVSRPHTHDGAGDIKPRALQACAGTKYTKHHREYKALGIGFSPFVVDTLGRLHDDALRTIWHLTSKQIARNFKRRGWQAGGRHFGDYQQDWLHAGLLSMTSIWHDPMVCSLVPTPS